MAGVFWFDSGFPSLGLPQEEAQQPVLNLDDFLIDPEAELSGVGGAALGMPDLDLAGSSAMAGSGIEGAQPKPKRKGGRKPLTAEQKAERKEKASMEPYVSPLSGCLVAWRRLIRG